MVGEKMLDIKKTIEFVLCVITALIFILSFGLFGGKWWRKP